MPNDRVQELTSRIAGLKKKRNATILAHNYQLAEVQDIADHTGDSLELSQIASRLDAEVILFAGVRFMAETASVLAPSKTVLLPSQQAGCLLANTITAAELERLEEEHPGAVVVCYVNSSVDVKARSDICCTSANAVKVVSSIPSDRKVIFVPDQYLGGFVRSRLHREMILWPGYCPTHARIRPEHVARRRSEHPDGLVMVHPESPTEVCELADEVLGTSGMCRVASESDREVFVVGTELGLIHRLQKENPGKRFVALTEQAICPDMKLTTLEEIAGALERMEHRIVVPEEIRVKALASVQRMVEIN